MMKRPWLWTGIALGAFLLFGLLLMPEAEQGPEVDRTRNVKFMQQSPPATPARQATPAENLSTPAQTNRRIADAAASVEGVRRAWGVVGGNIALVGVELDNMIKGAAIRATLADVEDQVKELPGVTQVAVTSDAGMVERIRDMSEEIASGGSTAQFTAEIRNLAHKILPAGD